MSDLEEQKYPKEVGITEEVLEGYKESEGVFGAIEYCSFNFPSLLYTDTFQLDSKDRKIYAKYHIICCFMFYVVRTAIYACRITSTAIRGVFIPIIPSI